MSNFTKDITSIKAFLDIRWSSGDPSIITKLLGMEPDEAWSKGDIISIGNKTKDLLIDTKDHRKRMYSCCKINAKVKKRTYNVEVYVNNIIRRITPIKDKLLMLPKDTNLMLCIWIDIFPTDFTPGIGLGLKNMRFLSDIRCELDVDISVFCPEQIDN